MKNILQIIFLFIAAISIGRAGTEFFETWTTDFPSQDLTITPTGDLNISTLSDGTMAINGTTVGTHPVLISGNQVYTSAQDLELAPDGDLVMVPVGDSVISSNLRITNNNELRLESVSGNYAAIKVSANISPNQTYVLPDQDGTNGQVLSTDGTGILSFIDGGDSIDPSVVDGAILFAESSAISGNEAVLNFDTANEYLGVGTNTPVSRVHAAGTGQATGSITVSRHSDNLNSPFLFIQKSRGTEAVPVRVNSNDVIGTLAFRGFNAANYTYGSKIESRAKENYTGSTSATDMGFYIRQSGAGAPVESLTLNDDITADFASDVTATGTITGDDIASTALTGGKVLISSGNSISESVVTTSELLLLSGSTGLAGANGLAGEIAFFDGTSDLIGETNLSYVSSTNTFVVSGAAEIDLLTFDSDTIAASSGDVGISNSRLTIKTENELRLEDATGGEYVALKAPTTVSANQTYVLPDADGVNGQALTTDGAGNLNWSNSGSFSFTASNDNRLLRSDTVDGNEVQESGITVDDTDAITGVTVLSLEGSSLINLQEISTPSTPVSPNVRVYVDSTEQLLATKDSDGDVILYGKGIGGTRLNLIDDGSFERKIDQGTCTSCTATNETSEVLPTDNNARSLKLAFSASSGDYTITETTGAQYSGVDMIARCWIKTSAADITFQVHANGTVISGLSQTVSSGDKWGYYLIPFTANTTSNAIVINAATSITDDVYVDECYLGADNGEGLKVGSPNSKTVSYTPTITGFGTGGTAPTSVNVFYSIEADKLVIEGTFTAGTPTATEGQVSLPVINGDQMTIGATKVPVVRVVGWGGRAVSTASATKSWNALAESGDTFINFAINHYASGDNPLTPVNGSSLVGAGEGVYFYAKIPMDSLSSSTHFLTQRYNWEVNANISGANPSLGTSSQSSYTGITDGSLTLTNNTSQSNVAIACSSTEEATIGDTTCTGNESVGITFDGWSGRVQACASFAHSVDANATGIVNAAFQLVKTGNADQTISTEGHERIQSSPDGSSATAQTATHPVKVCGAFDVDGKTTVRLFYEQSVAATITSNTVLADASAGTGQRDIHWSVIPITGVMRADVNGLSEAVDMTSSGSFTGGSFLVRRIGKQVTISGLTDPTHASSNNPISAAGLVPSWATPASRKINVYTIGTSEARRVDIDTTGTIEFSYYTSAFALTSLTSAGSSFNITYNVE